MSTPNDIFSDLSLRISETRRRECMTQQEAAALLNVSVRTFQAWEADVSFPRPGHRRSLLAWIATSEKAAA